MMEGINWAAAPEGTTHVITWGVKHLYRKVTEEDVYAWVNNRWDSLHYGPKDWFHDYAGSITERPKEPEEAVLPDGIEWIGGATHYCEIGLYKFFMNERNYEFCLVGKGQTWWPLGEEIFQYYRTKDNTITRFANEQVVKEQPKPIPKKPVGWWT